jgi:RNA polymerase sigma-70 factor (ECF subfamily)
MTVEGIGDDALVVRVRREDQDAFAELYRRHVGAVRLAVGDKVRDPEARADLVQEAFLRALVSIDRLNDPGKFRAWVLQIGRNLGLDHLRKQKTVVESLGEGPETEVEAADPDPQELYECAEAASRIRSGLARLSSRDAAVMSMSVQFGFGPTEIADALGISPNHAKVILHRARKRLRLAVDLDRELRQETSA